MPHEIKKIMRLIFYLLRAFKNQLQQNSNLLQLIINLLRLIFQ